MSGLALMTHVTAGQIGRRKRQKERKTAALQLTEPTSGIGAALPAEVSERSTGAPPRQLRELLVLFAELSSRGPYPTPTPFGGWFYAL